MYFDQGNEDDAISDLLPLQEGKDQVPQKVNPKHAGFVTDGISFLIQC